MCAAVTDIHATDLGSLGYASAEGRLFSLDDKQTRQEDFRETRAALTSDTWWQVATQFHARPKTHPAAYGCV